MRLGFDLDEVISQTAKMAIDYTNERLKCDCKFDSLESFYFEQNNFSDDPDEQKAIVDSLCHAVFDADLLATAEPYPDAVKVLRKLKHQGHKIFIITKRYRKDIDVTTEWLQLNKIPFEKVVVTDFREKGVFANRLKLDFFLDDLEENLYEMYKAKAHWHKGLFLITRPWNVNKYIDASKIRRIDNWNDIFKIISIGNRLKG